MTVMHRLGEEDVRDGGRPLAVLSDNRGLEAGALDAAYVDYTRFCPREWFTRSELARDVAAGALGGRRRRHGRLYEPAASAVEASAATAVLLYEGHYASASLPWWQTVRRTRPVVLYVHNPLSRTYGRRELRRLLAACDAVVFCAEHLRDDVVRRVGHVSTPMVVVHNGIDERFRAIAPRTAAPGPLELLYAGRLSEAKGVHVLLEAAELAARTTSRPLRVSVVGSANYAAGAAPDTYEQRLRDAAGRMDVPVTFTPFVPPEQMAGLMRSAGAVCLPSLWAEGFPLTALEAMASGTPVLASSSPGVREACGDVALVTAMGDTAALARSIVRLADDDGSWRAASAAGVERARSFTWAATHAGIRDVLDAVAQAPAPART